ncbi:MAG TPA: metalloregulator ArsR/SmtB family transcription factor [Candidatus Paceibacterota bacterium]|nr:metalloregulator ArsR/SmtB family transcription factor [Verrucomicrobiota bacterium]HRY51496.1 metalloregulator ArsR/SmtB family transcription factor [Candidatus Paceibacterota bacterium]HSA00540.1 metalloregulator ArsR/SmtB family transcription factor [Candidatus Paceibacterota bacterium]
MNKKTHKVFSDTAFQIIANRFKVLSDPSRLRILHALQGGEMNVSQLVAATGISQANVSKHLALLLEAVMVGRRREGANVFYSIADSCVFELCDLMCNKLQREFDTRAAEFA